MKKAPCDNRRPKFYNSHLIALKGAKLKEQSKIQRIHGVLRV